MGNAEKDELYNEDLSGDTILFYVEDPNDDPQNLIFKRLHNILAREAQKMSEEANIQSDNLNKNFTPKFGRAKIVKQIPNIITILFGLLTTIQGFALYYNQGGQVLTPDVVGITGAGMGIFLAGIVPLFSLEDDTFHLLLIVRANQDQLLAHSLEIKTQLSFLKIEIIDLKRTYLKNLIKNSVV
ncbi:MAG: hypothetical protein PHF57_11515 [Methanoregula sp.]|nr:hypothetical protein [Methanoregula sp.]